jgi:hypothetical protein
MTLPTDSVGAQHAEPHRLTLSATVSPAGKFEIVAITAGQGNGWTFTPAALQKSLALWDKVECFVDHDFFGHSVKDLAGVLHSPSWANSRRIGEIYWGGAALNFETLIVYGNGRPGIYYARASRAAVQTLTTATLTSISFDTEDVDTDGMFALGSPTQIFAVQPGLYLIQGTVGYAANNTGARSARLLQNASLIAGIDSITNGAVITTIETAFAVRYLAAGDALTLQAYQTSGGNLNTAAPTTLTVAALSA